MGLKQMFIGGKSQKESRYLLSQWRPGYKTHFDLNNILATLCLAISSVKISPANAIKLWAAILNLVSFSLDRRASDKPEKINISLLSGCCPWTLRDHKNWDELKSFLYISKYRGVWVFGVWVFGVWVLGFWVFGVWCLSFRGQSFRDTLKIPNGGRQTSWLFTSMIEELN